LDDDDDDDHHHHHHHCLCQSIFVKTSVSLSYSVTLDYWSLFYFLT